MEDGKHPLLDPRTVIGNDYSQGGDTVIITGSNMSGKSTFMRTLALNAVLAYAGGTVMAKNFRISRCASLHRCACATMSAKGFVLLRRDPAHQADGRLV